MIRTVNTRFTDKKLIQTRFQYNIIYNIYRELPIIEPLDHLKNIIRYQDATNR